MHVTGNYMNVTCNMHFYNYYTLPQFHYTKNSQTVLNTWTLVLLVTTTFIPQHIYKIPLSHTSLYMISIHLIYTTSSYLYPTPHYTLNHTAYPHMHISHPHSSLTTLLAYIYSSSSTSFLLKLYITSEQKENISMA